ncbi:hypothetical protein [Streptococcus pluranimalium]|uniref:hypothetical protein n=1 Tax=Streptococcus pluranimalium TaxID=82348 RepID=UPI003F68FECD
MRTYLARVLVEREFIPHQENYSSFSEFIILGLFNLSDELDFSQLIFDNKTDILEQILSSISKYLNDEYENANKEIVRLTVKEISKIEDTSLDFPLSDGVYEIDERLYTFQKSINFDEFRKMYYFGRFLD